MIFEITERKVLEARLLALNETLEARVAQVREEARALEVLNRTGIAVAAELDLERLVQTVTDAAASSSAMQSSGHFLQCHQVRRRSLHALYALGRAA